MKRLSTLILGISLLTMLSCVYVCEDRTFEISDELLAFIPYEETTNITMVNGENETMNYSIIPDTEMNFEKDDEGCTLTETNHFVTINTDIQDTFMRIMADANTYHLFLESFVFALYDVDGSCCLGSGTQGYPLYKVDSVNLNGNSYYGVIAVVNSSDTTNAIYMQKDIGLLGYQLMGETWVIQ